MRILIIFLLAFTSCASLIKDEDKIATCYDKTTGNYTKIVGYKTAVYLANSSTTIWKITTKTRLYELLNNDCKFQLNGWIED